MGEPLDDRGGAVAEHPLCGNRAASPAARGIGEGDPDGGRKNGFCGGKPGVRRFMGTHGFFSPSVRVSWGSFRGVYGPRKRKGSTRCRGGAMVRRPPGTV